LALLERQDIRKIHAQRDFLDQAAPFVEDDMQRKAMLAIALLVFASFAASAAQPIHEASRGELLYSTQCIACHSTQVHWRDKRIATDWTSLQLQVHRWQGVSGLQWSNEEIADVTGYLNSLHYHFVPPK
jgi:mono/diheme cytochrome c family protein